MPAEVSGISDVIHAVKEDEVRVILGADYYGWVGSWGENLQLTDGHCCRYLAVRKSAVCVRCGGGGSFGSTNLIIYYGLTNIIYQTVKPVGVLGVVQELCNILLSCHWAQNFVDVFQFPNNPRPSVSAPDLGCDGLTQFLSPRFLLEIVLRSRFAERFYKRFDPGSQGFYRLFVDLCLLGEL